MAKMVERSRLHVEGGDDMHTIRHLLIRYGIDYDSKPWPSWFPSMRLSATATGFRRRQDRDPPRRRYGDSPERR